MMKKFHIDIITPKGNFLSTDIEELYLKTSLGYMGIMAGHDSLITGVEVAAGFIIKNNKKDFYAFFGGLLEINKGMVKLVLNNIEHADSIDLERAKKAHERALERLKKKDDAIDTKRAELSLKRSIARIGSVKRDFL